MMIFPADKFIQIPNGPVGRYDAVAPRFEIMKLHDID